MLSSADVKNERTCTSTPHIHCHGVFRDNINSTSSFKSTCVAACGRLLLEQWSLSLMSFISMLDVPRGINYITESNVGEGVLTGRGRGVTLGGAEPTAPALASTRRSVAGWRIDHWSRAMPWRELGFDASMQVLQAASIIAKDSNENLTVNQTAKKFPPFCTARSSIRAFKMTFQ